MKYRKIKLGIVIGFWAFIMFILLIGIVVASVQLYLLYPTALIVMFLIVIPPFPIAYFIAKYKVVRREN